jgi:glutathione peroxidase
LLSGEGASSSAHASNAYDFSFQTIDGAPMPLSQYKGKVLLVVNTASFCGYTPQYSALEALWQKYRAKGLVVIGLPSNDFGAQEPGSAKEIKDFCHSKYDVDFPLATKVNVKGEAAHPFYQWAGSVLGEDKSPKWNFHKYLIGADGTLIQAFASSVKPDSDEVASAVEHALPSK